MPGPEMDIKRELFEAGNRLLKPPDSVDELLALLDRVEHCLSLVEQQPPVEMQDALCPAFKALITKELIQHPDTDVRVGVTACLTEISRITAPDVPYNDELMKEVFRLTISAFEGLADNSSKSFGKRASILETVARVRSCAVLLDLECDRLIVDMFQNFYKCIRGFHTANVFASMESIMTLVIEESEDISNDLLFALLSVLKKESEDASPIARKLGEKVVRNCATMLKSCIVDAIKSLKINLLDYDFVVTLACQMTPDHNPLGAPSSNGSQSNLKDVDEATQELVAEATPGSTMHTPSNFTVEAAEVAAQTLLEALGASRKPDSNFIVRPTETIQDNAEVGQDTPRSESVLRPELLCLSKSELRSEKIAKKRGRKPKNAIDIMHSDSGKLPRRDGKKGHSELPVSKVIVVTEVSEVSPEESSAPDASKKKSDSSNQVVSPIAIGPVNNAVTIEFPSISESHGKSSPKRVKRSKKPDSTQEATSTRQATERKASTGSDHTETGLVSSEKDAAIGGARDASKSITLVEVKKEPDIEGDSEDNPLRRSDAQLGVTDGTPRTKKRGRPRKDATISASTGAKDGFSSEGLPKKRSRRRFIAPEDGKEYAEELVGSRIKVWWPQDKVYYDGIVESFDPIRRKHKILYTDNEREVLNLHKEKWKLVKSREGPEKGGATGHSNTHEASDTQVVKKLKTGSSSAGGNTDSPPKKRRGRPPKNAVTLASYDTAAKIGRPEGETKADEAKNDSTADPGNPVKSTDPVAKHSGLPNLNAEIETSEHDVPENFETQAKKDSTIGTSVVDTVAPKAAVGLDINETFTLGSNEQPDENETAAATPNRGISDLNVIEEGKAVPPPGPKTEGVDQKTSASGTEIKRRKRKASSASPAVSGSTEIKGRKRKARTTFGSVSPAVPGGVEASTKRRRGRPPAKLTPDGKSKDLGKQLGERRSLGHSDNGVVVKSEDFPIEVRNVPFMSAPIKVSEHSVLDPNATKSTPDSVRFATKEGVGLAAENSSKSSTGELKIGSPTVLKVKFKNLDPEPKPRRRRARKDSTSPPQLNKDGSIRKPRGRPCKPKVEATKSEGSSNSTVAVHARKADDSAFAVKSETGILHKGQASLAKEHGIVSKNDAPDMGGGAVPKDHTPAGAGLSDKQIAGNDDSTLLSKLGAMGTGDLKLGLAMETKGEDGASQKSPESRTSKDSSATTTSDSSKELHG